MSILSLKLDVGICVYIEYVCIEYVCIEYVIECIFIDHKVCINVK